mmetsp:Transcript_6035/g.10898  ORF Transcript_6035/g.10898 Transcript_6035/m.10898 type:complete len:199 (-) Transcript_6035:207-803(-)|eukprot:CAMPEP_0177769702 /NCGR_PEP_ID=MMETSP0491_2-20121128/10491_1 /TAXON_ID=63592 /ORGANISM="Tetraselmis chuii, Strain PLY429" /LENGTH=198 /DNA_ID=CAMNT_0019286785 /DNA_START=428 /DNA_END=1024 /DNA_ORIENTATION=+
MANPAATSFTVMVTGEIDHAKIPDCDNAYCKYQVVHGEDWKFIDGLEDGLTQVTRRSTGADDSLVWNFPIDLTYNSTNVFGWPQIILTVFSVSSTGKEIIIGYGCMHLPTCPGRYSQKLRLFRPKSSSLMQSFFHFMAGTTAEFSDPKFPSYGEGREVTRVVSCGYSVLNLNVLTKDMEQFGYNVGSCNLGEAGITML